LIGVLGILAAFIIYKKETLIPEKIARFFGALYKAAFNKFYIDEIYLFITKTIIFNYISRPIAWFDRHIIDGSMNGIAWVTATSSEKIKGLQSGQLQQYALVFVSGAVGLVLLFLYWFNV